jgi:hypothetical protein
MSDWKKKMNNQEKECVWAWKTLVGGKKSDAREIEWMMQEIKSCHRWNMSQCCRRPLLPLEEAAHDKHF